MKKNNRLNQKNTPRFWKRVRNWALVIAALGGSVLTAGATLPLAVITIATVVTSGATAIAGAAALTKNDDDDDAE